ncbi:GSCFA domain-containing protein [Dyadobacter sp. CY312]|uniref:GSCFA domain-containing protein n=1 Tax=Dyadobacter sp. CY312 TaxID=2907303 RepID=UPI001F349347|nr:GSCFA domain-containing protein [Dyadobacter sp. CY312]MCE7042571.1 GSCFA domain-containing protein [Dyadobacter sp. CY312]
MKPIRLHTEVTVSTPDWKIDQHSKILTIGSCFAEVMGSQLIGYKFPVLNNPLGTVFNPISICKILDSALENRKPNPALYFEDADKIWFHHDFHSSQWATSRERLENQLVEKLAKVKDFLNTADVLVITLGTAYAYRHRAANTLIGNCHKVPADRFVKELLHSDQISIPFEQLMHKLRSFRRDLRIILTVSPVRHTRDTLPLNQVSKATLRLLCHRLSEKFVQAEYFPSYEIMVDELRDYRYYEEDLIHPNSVAEEYIFRTFADSYINPATYPFMKEWEGIGQLMNHRPQHGYTASQYKLLINVRTRLKQLSATTDVSDELEEIERRIREFPAAL